MTVSDSEPRYQLLDSNGNKVGSLYINADGDVAIQEGTNQNELTLASDGTVGVPALDTESVYTNRPVAGRMIRDGSTYIVYGANGEISSNTDPAAALNTALSSISLGVIEVALQENLPAQSTLTISKDRTGVILPPGSTWDYKPTGGDIFHFEGTELTFIYDKVIFTNSANRVIYDTGLRRSNIIGNRLPSASDSIYHFDPSNVNTLGNASFGGGGGNEIKANVWYGPTTTIPLRLDSGTDSTGSLVTREGDVFDILGIAGATDRMVKLGDASHNTHMNQTVHADLDPTLGGSTTALAEIHNEANELQLKGYVQASGNWDVIIGSDATDWTVTVPGRKTLRLRDDSHDGGLYQLYSDSYTFDGILDRTAFRYVPSANINTSSGSTSWDGKYRTVETTGATSGNYAEFTHELNRARSTPTFDSMRRFSASVNFNQDTNQTVYITNGGGGVAGGTSEHFGIRIVGGDVQASVADGTTQNTLSTGYTITAPEIVQFDAVLNPSGEMVAYVNGSQKTTLTSNLPTGGFGQATNFGRFYVETTTSANRSMEVGEYRYVQE